MGQGLSLAAWTGEFVRVLGSSRLGSAWLVCSWMMATACLNWLQQIIEDPLMRHSALLVFANKQDLVSRQHFGRGYASRSPCT